MSERQGQAQGQGVRQQQRQGQGHGQGQGQGQEPDEGLGPIKERMGPTWDCPLGFVDLPLSPSSVNHTQIRGRQSSRRGQGLGQDQDQGQGSYSPIRKLDERRANQRFTSMDDNASLFKERRPCSTPLTVGMLIDDSMDSSYTVRTFVHLYICIFVYLSVDAILDILFDSLVINNLVINNQN